MKVFWYIFFLLVILTAAAVGWRGKVFLHEPVQLFTDMVRQDRLEAQSTDAFFLNGSGPRPLPPGSVPLGLREELPQSVSLGRALVYSSPGAGYFETGVWDGYYGQSLPKEVKPLSKEAALGFFKKGKVSFENQCVVCHGVSGNGHGVAASYPGFPVLVDWKDPMYERKSFPDGRLFFVITHGQGNMMGYGAHIPVADRWGIVAYIRVLQAARKEAGVESGKGGPDGN